MAWKLKICCLNLVLFKCSKLPAYSKLLVSKRTRIWEYLNTRVLTRSLNFETLSLELATSTYY